MPTHAGYASLNGADFYYETAMSDFRSDGPPLVLIHAGIADSRMWDGQFAALAEQFTVTRYDLRGFGRTLPAAGPLPGGRFAHADDLRALLDFLGADQVSLVGCSLGSRTALAFALAHPERVARLVLTSPAVSGFRYDGPPPPQAEALDAAEEAGDLARVNELEMQIWVDGPHRAPDEAAPAMRALAREMNAIALANEGVAEEEPPPPAADRLAEVRAPALVVTGALDTGRTLAAAGHLLAHLPRVRRVDLPGAAHLPNMEQPAAYTLAVLDFLTAGE